MVEQRWKTTRPSLAVTQLGHEGLLNEGHKNTLGAPRA